MEDASCNSECRTIGPEHCSKKIGLTPASIDFREASFANRILLRLMGYNPAIEVLW